MSYIYLNNNPCRRSVSDCVIRAVAKVLNISWEDAYKGLCDYGLELCDLPNANATFNKFLIDAGFRKRIIPNACPTCYSLKEFCLDHPYGEYVVCTGDHAVAVIDGNYYDHWDSGYVIPTYYYERGDL